MTNITFRFRQDSADAWTSNNPVLAAGEIGVELDSAGGVSPKFKIGNGILAWNDSSFNYFINDSDQAGLAGGAGGGASFDWGGDRVTVAGGDINGSSSATNVIDYYNITSTSNSTDFGDLLASGFRISAVSSTSRVVYGPSDTGSLSTTTNVLQYITPSTLSNATDFGDRTVTYDTCSTTSDGTYGLFSGANGINNGGAPYSTNVIDYITIATTSNATDFGDLTSAQENMASGVISNGTYGILSKPQSDFSNYVTIATPANATLLTMTSATSANCAAFSDNTYGVIQGGQTIEYFNIGTTISVTDFGDTTTSQSHAAGASNGTYGTINGGYKFDGATNIYNIIEYVTIATPSNATDFGDLTVNRMLLGAGSGSPS